MDTQQGQSYGQPQPQPQYYSPANNAYAYPAASAGGTYAQGAQPGKPGQPTVAAVPMQYTAPNYAPYSNANPNLNHPDTFDHQHFTKREGKFTLDLLTCCSRGSGFCYEGYCCYYCNLARQCGLGTGDRFATESGVGVGIGMCVGDWFTLGFLCLPCGCGGCVSWIVNCLTRAKTRQRFGIEGSCCGDCCVAMWCSWCAVQQSLGEYVAWGYNPPTGCNTYGEADHYPTPQIGGQQMD